MNPYLISGLYVFLGGGLGSLTRYGISLLLNKYPRSIPLDTFSANLISCILLGWFVMTVRETGNTSVSLFWMIGFCGGFSTFSTFTMDHIELFEAGRYLLAISYIAVSLIGCTLGFFIGWWIYQYTR